MALYSKAVKQSSSNSELYGALAICQMSQAVLSRTSSDDKLKSARKYLEHARRLDSKNWRIQNNLAICCYLIPDAVAATTELNKLNVFRGIPTEQWDSINTLIQTCQIMRKIDD